VGTSLYLCKTGHIIFESDRYVYQNKVSTVGLF